MQRVDGTKKRNSYRKKVDFPIDKRKLHPSLIPGPIVLISTYNSKKEPNISPKSWLQMVSFEPPILMFSGSKENTTERNVIEHNCFGVNFVDSSMASKVYGCIKWHGKERIERTGSTIIEASKIYAPLVDECKAHLECCLHSTKEVGSGFVIFGEIVAASIWEEILLVGYEKRYELLDQIVYLEEGMFSRINKAIKMIGLETTILTGLHGEKMMMVLNSTLPAHPVLLHSHPHEQIGIVYAGKGRLRIGDEERIVQKGDFYCIPANVPHGDTCIGDEPFVMLDIFYPVREDFIEKLTQSSNLQHGSNGKEKTSV